MSTRSMIGVVDNAGQVAAVYCHFDGYLEGVGRTLAESWNSKEDAMRLIVGGGCMRALGDTLEHCDFFENEPFEMFSSIDEFVGTMASSDIEYLYLFVDGRWVVMSDHHEVNPLTEVA